MNQHPPSGSAADAVRNGDASIWQQQQQQQEQEHPNGGTDNDLATRRTRRRIPAISQKLVWQLSGFCCQTCHSTPRSSTAMINGETAKDKNGQNNKEEDDEEELRIMDYNLQALAAASPVVASPLVLAPMTQTSVAHHSTVESVLSEYIAACRFYGATANAGILTSLRFALPCWRTSDTFHDTDMLALCEVLLRHCNGPLRYVKRLDFSVSGKYKDRSRNNSSNNNVGGVTHGIQSHGALALAKVLQVAEHLTEVRLQRNSIGPYGASAIFLACAQNPTLRSLGLRRCRVGERGALVLADILLQNGPAVCGLRQIDLSANYIGHLGCQRVESAVRQRNQIVEQWTANTQGGGGGAATKTSTPNNSVSSDAATTTTTAAPPNLLTVVDLEGNLVFQEVMNALTHGLGVLLAFWGSFLMSRRVAGKSTRHVTSCAVYNTSLVVLYTSSTLYHSFFTMQNTKYIFEVLDKCAIYILIAGSYTPFLQIVLAHEPMWSTGLLSFLWLCGVLGIGVEACLPVWRYRKIFSLAMYLGMGWSALVCLPEVARVLPDQAISLMILGGVAYTSGVPFYVRSNNLDHAIWHLFVLAGSIFHWLGIYLYVATWEEGMEA